jgi:hypothetical protein
LGRNDFELSQSLDKPRFYRRAVVPLDYVSGFGDAQSRNHKVQRAIGQRHD